MKSRSSTPNSCDPHAPRSNTNVARPRIVHAAGAAFLTLLVAGQTSAHPISLLSGRVVVKPAAVDVQFDVPVEEFVHHDELRPDNDGRLSPDAVRQAIERHKTALLESLVIRDASGERLYGTVEAATPPSRLTQPGVALRDVRRAIIQYQIRYPVAERPTLLSFYRQGTGSGLAPSVMELNVLREGLSLPETIKLSNGGNVRTLEFDWDEVEPPGLAPNDLLRLRRERDHAHRLGLRREDEVYGFVYIEPKGGVRVQILMPLETFETWQEIPRNDPDYLTPDEQAAAVCILTRFFADAVLVFLDGTRTPTEVRSVRYVPITQRDIGDDSIAQRLPTATTRIAAELDWTFQTPPKRIALQWQLFNSGVFQATTLLVADDETRARLFSPYQPRFEWQRPAATPDPGDEILTWHSSQPLDRPRAQQIVSALLAAAHHPRTPVQANPTLGPMSEYVTSRAWLDVINTLVPRMPSADAPERRDSFRPHSFEVTDVSSLHIAGDGRSFSLDATIRVTAASEHWGHLHLQSDRVSVRIRADAEEGRWKIAEIHETARQSQPPAVQVRDF